MIRYNEGAAPLAASAVFTSASRDAERNGALSYFHALARSDAAGSVRIEGSADGLSWAAESAETAVAAATPVALKIPAISRYYRLVYTNGAAPQTAFVLRSGFSVS